jgi:hypothetical protein
LQFGFSWTKESKVIYVDGAIDLFGVLHLGVNVSIGVGSLDFEFAINVIDLIVMQVGVHAEIPIPNIPLPQPNMALQVMDDLEAAGVNPIGAILNPEDAANRVGGVFTGYGNEIASQISNIFDPDKSAAATAVAAVRSVCAHHRSMDGT